MSRDMESFIKTYVVGFTGLGLIFLVWTATGGGWDACEERWAPRVTKVVAGMCVVSISGNWVPEYAIKIEVTQ